MFIKRAFSGHSFLHVILGRKTIGKLVFLRIRSGRPENDRIHAVMDCNTGGHFLLQTTRTLH
jgi:hypothetical protein